MPIPMEIVFHNVDRSEAVQQAVRERAAKLEPLAPNITSCRVTIEAPHKHHRKGNLYTVRIDLRYAGGESLVSRAPSAHHAHEDVYVAVRDAFDAARRQVQDFVRIHRGQIKPHEAPAHGRISALDRERDCGRIATADGREVYFHRNSVVNASFDRLEPGAEVRFDEEVGEQGPQASTVHVLGKHHIAG